MRTGFVLLCFLVTFSFAGLNQYLDPQGFDIEILPPAKLELSGIVTELKVKENSSNYSFVMIVTNKADKVYVVDLTKDILLFGQSPVIEYSMDRVYTVLPNESQEIKFSFSKNSLPSEKVIELVVKASKFLVKLHVVSPEVSKLNYNNVSLYAFAASSELLAIQNKITGDILIVNESRREIKTLRYLGEDKMEEFIQLDYKHWLLREPNQTAISKNNLIVLKENNQQDYLVYILDNVETYSTRVIINKISSGNYMTQLIPGEVKGGEYLLFRIVLKGNANPLRITAVVNQYSFALQSKDDNTWEYRYLVPNSLAQGQYPVEFYIRENGALSVQTEYFRVL